MLFQKLRGDQTYCFACPRLDPSTGWPGGIVFASRAGDQKIKPHLCHASTLGYPARCLELQGELWDWLALCWYTVTRWDDLICNVYLSVVVHAIVWADSFLRYRISNSTFPTCRASALRSTLPDGWSYRVSTWTGWPGVGLVYLDETKLICNAYLSVAAHAIVWADFFAEIQQVKVHSSYMSYTNTLGTPCQTPGITGSALGLVGLVLVYCQ